MKQDLEARQLHVLLSSRLRQAYHSNIVEGAGVRLLALSEELPPPDAVLLDPVGQPVADVEAPVLLGHAARGEGVNQRAEEGVDNVGVGHDACQRFREVDWMRHAGQGLALRDTRADAQEAVCGAEGSEDLQDLVPKPEIVLVLWELGKETSARQMLGKS